MAPSKRNSVAASPKKQPPAKRAKVAAPEAPLVDFLGKCEEIPKPCREMLQVALPFCLEVVESERHKYLADVLERVAGLLASVEGKKRDQVKEAEAELKGIEGEKDAASAHETDRTTAESAKKSECDEKGKVVDTAREVCETAKKALEDAQGAQEAFNSKKTGLLSEQESFAKLLAETYEPLKDGSVQGNWQKKAKLAGELKKKLLALGSQESLGEALVATLKMTPANREGTFHQITLKYAEEEFNKHTSKVASDIAGLDAEAAGHVSAIGQAETVLQEKKTAVEALEKEWDEMQDVWVGISDEVAKASKELRKLEAKIPKAEKNIDKAKAELDKFLEVPALFAKLKEKSTAATEEPNQEADQAEKPAEKNEAEA